MKHETVANPPEGRRMRRNGPREQDGEANGAGESTKALRGAVQPAELPPHTRGHDACRGHC